MKPTDNHNVEDKNIISVVIRQLLAPVSCNSFSSAMDSRNSISQSIKIYFLNNNNKKNTMLHASAQKADAREAIRSLN